MLHVKVSSNGDVGRVRLRGVDSEVRTSGDADVSLNHPRAQFTC